MADPSEYAPEELLGPLNDLEEKHAPKRLFVAGDRSVLAVGPRISIVGTRKPSAVGIRRAEELARALVKAGAVVVSGLAEGIDTAAHTAAIRAEGRTIAVLGTPLDSFFPASNRELQLTIMRDHLAVSQFPSGTPPRRQNFPSGTEPWRYYAAPQSSSKRASRAERSIKVGKLFVSAGYCS
jgi:DNA processing protein